MVPRWLLAGLIAGALLERITKRSRRKKGEGKGDLLDVRNGARDFRVERAHHGELLQSIQEEELAEDAQAEAVDNQDRDGEPLLSGPNEQLLNGLHTNPNLSGDSAGNGLLTLAPVMDQNVEPLERVEPEDLSSADQTAMTESPEEQASHDIEIEDGDMLEVEQGWAESAEATDVVIEPRMLDGTDPSVDGEGQDDQEAHANEDLVLPSADQSASQENVEASSAQDSGAPPSTTDDMERSPEQPAAALQSPATAGGQDEERESMPPPSAHKVLRPRVSPPLVRVGLTVPSPLEHQRPGLAGLLKDRDFDRHSSAYGVRLWMVTPDMASRL